MPELLRYSQFLQDVSEIALLDSVYIAPMRDATDLAVLQTAERGAADIVCTRDADFFTVEPANPLSRKPTSSSYGRIIVFPVEVLLRRRGALLG